MPGVQEPAMKKPALSISEQLHGCVDRNVTHEDDKALGHALVNSYDQLMLAAHTIITLPTRGWPPLINFMQVAVSGHNPTVLVNSSLIKT